ncbi:ParA family protein [Inediibacterium massiliense]|uniref:ParA family protein n=1 Tax=Inediibacterium massiliense TaxID=1658111 RepID=UPI0006B60A25|nr:AAA family ATPase [Inediibacterium massiliense]
MKVITFFNNKGGVGKTTSAVNIASYFAKKLDKRILFMDLDPQSNSTQLVVREEDWGKFYGPDRTEKTIYDYFRKIIIGEANIQFYEVPIKTSDTRYNFHLIPGHPKLSIIEEKLSKAWTSCFEGDIGGFRVTNWLRQFEDHYKEEYDYIIIDLGPSLGALNRSILLNSHYFITPMGSDIFSLLGIDNLSQWFNTWKTLYKDALKVLHRQYEVEDYESFNINHNPDEMTKFIGFSVQQYVKRKFKSGYRAIRAYEEVIENMPNEIKEKLQIHSFENLTLDDLKLGDIPYLYSLIPLSQTSKAPIFELEYSDGVRGAQSIAAEEYGQLMDSITKKILSNMEVNR